MSAALTRLNREASFIPQWQTANPSVTFVHSEDLFTWTLSIKAPAKYTVGGAERDSPYSGRVFDLRLVFSEKYPHEAPEIHFQAGLFYNPSVNAEGGVCPDMLWGSPSGSTWSPAKKICDIASAVIDKILTNPSSGSPYNAEAQAEFSSDISAFEAKARIWAAKAAKA